MNFHSIRWQLQIWHGIILLAVLTGFGFTVYRLQSVNELRRVDQGLRHRLGALHEALRGPLPGPPGRPPGAPGSPSVSDPRRIGEPRPGDASISVSIRKS